MSNQHFRSKGKANIWIILGIFALALLFFGGAFSLYYFKGAKRITTKEIEAAEKIIGLHFTQKERKMMLENLRRNLQSYAQMREVKLDIPLHSLNSI